MTNKFKSALEFLRENKIKMLQRPKELRRLFNLISEMDAKVFVEIGSGQGASAYVLAQAMDHPVIYIIDKNEPPERKIVIDELCHNQHGIFSFIGKSNDENNCKAFKKVLDKCSNGIIDILFIDGDHTYEAVKSDYEMYSPLVRKGGIIAFHDIVKHPDKPKTQVWRLWKELKAKHDVIEFIEGKHKVGIGVIIK